jgi:hypothetical protein
MSIATGLRESWAVAATAPVGRGLRATPLPGSGSRVWVTVTDEGAPGLLIAARSGELIGDTIVQVKRASSVLDAELYPFDLEGATERGLHIWCNRSDLVEAFIGFCEPFVLRLSGGEEVRSAFAACFEEFRRLLSGTGEAGLGSSLAGLLGELVVLRGLVEHDAFSLDYWAYPERARHDFRHKQVALEVKTSIRSQRSMQVVTISAIDQLDPPEGGVLYLKWMRVEQVQGGSLSIAALVDALEKRLAAPDAGALRDRVYGAKGPQPQHLIEFELQAEQSFRVDPGFPRLSLTRLVGGALDTGVTHVTYDLDLAAAKQWECSDAEAFGSLLKGVRS